MRKLGFVGLFAVALTASQAMGVAVDFGFQGYAPGSELIDNGWDCWAVGVTNGSTANSCAVDANNTSRAVVSQLGTGEIVAGATTIANGGGDWAFGNSVLLPGAVAMTDPLDPSSSAGLTSGQMEIQVLQGFAADYAGVNIMTTFSGAYHGGNWQGNSEMKYEISGGNVQFKTFTSYTLGTKAELADHRVLITYNADFDAMKVTSIDVEDLDGGAASTGWDGSSFNLPVNWNINNTAAGGSTGVTHFAFHACCEATGGAWIGVIPEPGTLALLGFGGLSMLMRRRRVA
jgi:hypothetical protein